MEQGQAKIQNKNALTLNLKTLKPSTLYPNARAPKLPLLTCTRRYTYLCTHRYTYLCTSVKAIFHRYTYLCAHRYTYLCPSVNAYFTDIRICVHL
jgi:hypothetical protein